MKKGLNAFLILALLAGLSVAFFAFERSSKIQDNSPEALIKQRVSALLIPILGREAFRVEASIDQKDQKQTIAISLDEKKQLSSKETDDIILLVRAAVGFDIARGDVLRMIPMAFKSNSFDFLSDKLMVFIEILTLLLIILVAFWFYNRKPKNENPNILPEKNAPTLSDHVLQNPDKAASLMRVWMAP